MKIGLGIFLGILGGLNVLAGCNALAFFPLGQVDGASIATVAAIPLTKGERAKKKLQAANGGTEPRGCLVARVAVQLAREDAGRYMTADELAGYANALVDASTAARRALLCGKDPVSHYAAAREVLEPFGARLLANGDVRGMVVGVRFNSGRHVRGPNGIFYVT